MTFSFNCQGKVSDTPPDMVVEQENNFEHSFPYRGSALLLWFWLGWSIIGYLFLLHEDADSTIYQALYIISAIMAAMGINNRKYGINHRILFFSDHVVLPKPIHLWHWREEKIFYRDIQDIRFAPVAGPDGRIEIGEIELKTSESAYPIFYHKLPLQAMQEILRILSIKTGMKGSLIPAEEWVKPETGSLTFWQWRMIKLALVVSFWALLVTQGSEGYRHVLAPTTIFFYAFAIAGTVAILIYKLMGKGESKTKRWQNIFLLIYFTFYGGISIAFTMIFLNGALDNSTPTIKYIPIVSEVVFDERRGDYCITTPVSGLGEMGRSIASVDGASENAMIELCRPEFEKAEKGTQIKLSIKSGYFIGPWIKEMEILPMPAKSNLDSQK